MGCFYAIIKILIAILHSSSGSRVTALAARNHSTRGFLMGKIVIFGAGANGRGHIGLLAWQAGHEVVFVDKDTDLVDLLKRSGHYRVELYGESRKTVDVSGYRIYPHDQRQAIAEEISTAALVLTAVFAENLPDVSQTVALAAAACRKAGRIDPLNFIACENMMNSSSRLGGLVFGQLREENLAYAQQFFGFPDSMVGRVVPRPEPDPLVIVTENYTEWTARAEAFKGDKPAGLDALELVPNQTARLERKLFIHNGSHAICGYMGYHRGHRYIHEALQDPVVSAHVRSALDELGEVVRRRHGFSAESIDAYKKEVMQRGAIPEMKDDILRVIRDPLRKLSPRERLVAPALLAGEYGLPRQWIVKGIVGVLKYQDERDEQSMALADMLRRKSLPAVLEEVCQIQPGSDLSAEIQQSWERWE
jgi:mannitol-1-phosphate 5-dehydrogenase